MKRKRKGAEKDYKKKRNNHLKNKEIKLLIIHYIIIYYEINKN